MNQSSGLLPPSGSTIAPEVDALLHFLFYAALGFIIIVYTGVVFFTIRYRRRKTSKLETTSGPSQNIALEITWTLVPLVLVLFLFIWGFRSYVHMSVVPKDAMEIKVTAQKWFWSFPYPEGASTVNELVVPVGLPIKLLMSSKDVIHSFYVPNFRLKRDVLPNRYSIIWFEATQLGEADLFCAEYCGSKHSGMIGKVRVVSEREYRDWLKSQGVQGEGMGPRDFGAKLLVSKGCSTCHSVDGTPGNGPTLLGLFDQAVKMQDGSGVTADENYLRESILNPQARVVAGYQPIMPTYQTVLKDSEIDALIAYIKSLSGE